MSRIAVPDLGGYLREQREAAQMTLRQAAAAAGISNPYLSQIERGLRRPSAEILQQLAKGLQISAEQLYVRAGILDADTVPPEWTVPGVVEAVKADKRLTARQRDVLLDVYRSFVGEEDDAVPPRDGQATPATTTSTPTRGKARTGS